MKITLYTPDGTAETFRDCEIDGRIPGGEFGFTGTDYNGKRRVIQTTLWYSIDFNEAYRLPANTVTASEVFNASPLVQQGGTTFGQLQ